MNYANLILKEEARIFAGLRNGSIAELNFIQQRFQKEDVSRDRVFQFNLIHYYLLDRAKGLLTDKFISTFFGLLQNNRKGISFTDCVTALQKVSKKFHAVFASKLCATINPEHPIYDERVRLFYGLQKRSTNLGFDLRLKKIREDLKTIQKNSEEILKDKKIIKMIGEVRKEFPFAKKEVIPDLRLIDLFIYHANLK
jgi:hypothetical protein